MFVNAAPTLKSMEFRSRLDRLRLTSVRGAKHLVDGLWGEWDLIGLGPAPMVNYTEPQLPDVWRGELAAPTWLWFRDVCAAGPPSVTVTMAAAGGDRRRRPEAFKLKQVAVVTQQGRVVFDIPAAGAGLAVSVFGSGRSEARVRHLANGCCEFLRHFRDLGASAAAVQLASDVHDACAACVATRPD